MFYQTGREHEAEDLALLEALKADGGELCAKARTAIIRLRIDWLMTLSENERLRELVTADVATWDAYYRWRDAAARDKPR